MEDSKTLNKKRKRTKKSILKDKKKTKSNESKTINIKNIQFLENLTNNDIKKNDYIEIFTLFNSIFNIPTLVLAYEQSIIIYNLINKQIINEIKDIVVNSFSDLKHYSDKKNKRDLLMINCENDILKIFNINTMECILNIKEDSTLYSSFITTNVDKKHINIINNNQKLYKIYNLNGKLIKNVGLSYDEEEKIIIKDIYHDEISNKNYLVIINDYTVIHIVCFFFHMI